MAVAVSRGPQRKLSQLTVRQVQPSFLGSGLLLHQAKVLFQGHFGSLQSFDRNTFDPRFPQPHVKGSLGRIDKEHHLLLGVGLADVIRLMIDAHAAISPHSPGERLPIEGLQPGIGVDRGGQGR